MGIAWRKTLSEKSKARKWCLWDLALYKTTPKQTSINQKQKKVPKYNLFSLKAGFLFICNFLNLFPELSIGNMHYFYDQNVLNKWKHARWYIHFSKMVHNVWNHCFIFLKWEALKTDLVPYFRGDAKFFWREFDEWKCTNESDKPSLICHIHAYF